MLDPNFEPVNHTAKRQVEAIFHDLALAAGNDPASYSIELMQDRRGHRAINAMTCASSRVIWLSVTAWEQLHDHKPALALILAHELAHADHRHPSKLKHDPMTAAERQLLSSLTPRQKVEIAADHRAADLMAIAGYTTTQINQASRYILARDENGILSKATYSHPAGRDRINLMTFYLGRTMVPQLAR
jgi:Zn-dependent protease with chaperone function